jgi:hypothetical protein
MWSLGVWKVKQAFFIPPAGEGSVAAIKKMSRYLSLAAPREGKTALGVRPKTTPSILFNSQNHGWWSFAPNPPP